MKAIRIAMMVLAIIVGMVSASAEKRIHTIKAHQSEPGRAEQDIETLYLECLYDEVGKLSSVLMRRDIILYGSSGERPSWLDADSIIFNLKWSPNSLEVRGWPGKYTMDYLDTLAVYNLNAKGNVEWQILGDKITRFTYNDQDVISEIVSSYGTATARKFRLENNGDNVSQLWVNDGLYTSYTYLNVPNKSQFHMSLFDTHVEYNENRNPVLWLAGITGKAPANLVEQVQWTNRTETYTYEYDNDGYVTKISGKKPTWYTSQNPTLTIDITYTDTNGVSIVNNDNDTAISVDGKMVYANGLPIIAYDLHGRMVKLSDNGTLLLPASGIYIVRAGTKAVKVVVE